MSEYLPSQVENKSLFSETERSFLEGVYLQRQYVVDNLVQERITSVVDDLCEKYPKAFHFLALVGGQANGSFVLRTLQNNRVASDLDIYIGGEDSAKADLMSISEGVRRGTKSTGIGIDGVLNGTRLDRYLNLAKIPEHISAKDFDLLSLPFQCSFGRVSEARTRVIKYILESPDKDEIWNEIRSYHQQSLSLHSSHWSDEFNQQILDSYYIRKIQKFSLPQSPSDLLM
jgi:hypothetical protein